MRIGIIGYGRIGQEHAKWISTSAEVALVADPTAARREIASVMHLKTVDDPAQLIADNSIDAVLVSSPTSMHFEHAMAALRVGKHVMVEKPMAMDLVQARQMVEEAEQRKLVLSVFHNRRWDIDFLTLRGAIAQGLLGKIINI